MLSHAGMANAIALEQLAVDEGVFGVYVKDARAELVNVRDRIDELTDEMAGIPFQAEVLALGFVEHPLPNRRLPEHVVVHDRQVIRPLRTMFEGDPHRMIGRKLR